MKCCKGSKNRDATCVMCHNIDREALRVSTPKMLRKLSRWSHGLRGVGIENRVTELGEKEPNQLIYTS